jgi:integrase
LSAEKEKKQNSLYYLQSEAPTAYKQLGQSEEEQKAREKQTLEGKVLPHIRFHDLRHMHVSLLNKAGVDARTIADCIGHTDPAFTLKRYAHVFEDQRRGAAISLSKLFIPTSPRSCKWLTSWRIASTGAGGCLAK